MLGGWLLSTYVRTIWGSSEQVLHHTCLTNEVLFIFHASTLILQLHLTRGFDICIKNQVAFLALVQK